jgi:hypothetical protein
MIIQLDKFGFPVESKPRNELITVAQLCRAAQKVWANMTALENRRRIAELRKSCGAVSKTEGLVSVRLAPRYGL